MICTSNYDTYVDCIKGKFVAKIRNGKRSQKVEAFKLICIDILGLLHLLHGRFQVFHYPHRQLLQIGVD